MEHPRKALPEVAGFQMFRRGRIWGFVNKCGEGEHGQVTPRVVVSIEERELLLTVRGVVVSWFSVNVTGGL